MVDTNLISIKFCQKSHEPGRHHIRVIFIQVLKPSIILLLRPLLISIIVKLKAWVAGIYYVMGPVMGAVPIDTACSDSEAMSESGIDFCDTVPINSED